MWACGSIDSIQCELLAECKGKLWTCEVLQESMCDPCAISFTSHKQGEACQSYSRCMNMQPYATYLYMHVNICYMYTGYRYPGLGLCWRASDGGSTKLYSRHYGLGPVALFVTAGLCQVYDSNPSHWTTISTFDWLRVLHIVCIYYICII